MDRSNIAFALITSIIGLYIAVALLMSRARQSRAGKPGRHSAAGPEH